MKIATFNVENLDHEADDKKPTLERRKPTLRANLERTDASIICLQEVHGQETASHRSDNPDRILSALDSVLDGTRFENYERAFTQTSDHTPYDKRNLVILSRYPIDDIQQYRNTFIDQLEYKKVTAKPEQTHPQEISWERPILHATIALTPIKSLHVINLHLKSRLASSIAGQKNRFTWNSAAGWAEGYFLSSMKRVGQALETRILIDKIFDQDPDANIIVCGDFNAEPGEVPVQAIAGRTEDTNNPNLRPRALVSCSRGIPVSIRYSHLHHGEKNLLDHILISQSLLPHFRGASVHNENLHDESLPYASDTKYPESDHAPFVAEFDL